MGPQIVWLEGEGVDLAEVGPRAQLLARLRTSGLAVPRAFVLGRTLIHRIVSDRKSAESPTSPPLKIPTALQHEVAEAVRALGGAFAIRRSPFEAGHLTAENLTDTRGGRPERETYLHLLDVADAVEAVRRIWAAALSGKSPPRVAIVVQRFIVPEISAILRRDRHDPGLLHVISSLGVGDLLAAGLVVPDRHTLRVCDGSIQSSILGRKAQMSVPRQDGGLLRVPVPAASARRMALDATALADTCRLFLEAEEAAGPLQQISVAFAGAKTFITTAVPAAPPSEEPLHLG
jgi:hypothetical protein